MNLVNLFQQGGIFMIPLFGLSILGLAVAIERALFFAGLEWGGENFRDKLRSLLNEGQEQQALQWLAGLRGPLPRLATLAVQRWKQGRSSIESGLLAQAHREQMVLMRFLPILETTVTASPLIGLLGTITGMMGVFRAVSLKIAENPQADTSGILAGIGEALVATATGIFIAVTCLFFHNFFQRLAEQQMDASQDLANQLLDWVDHRG